jgi:anaerobic selenocysteine-containing dehydrogenase
VSLRKRAPEPVTEISPKSAESRSIRDGDPVIVRTRVGTARFTARVTPMLRDDVVVAEYGWWQACPELGRARTRILPARHSASGCFITPDAFPACACATFMTAPRMATWRGSISTSQVGWRGTGSTRSWFAGAPACTCAAPRR